MQIADAYLVPARTVSLPGAPGTRLDFRAGRCTIHDPRLVPIVLRMPDVTVQFTERYASQAQDFIAQCGENYPARAKVALTNWVVLEPPAY